jgi:hypothetical protein
MRVGIVMRAAMVCALVCTAFVQRASAQVTGPHHLDLPIEGDVAPHWTEMPTGEQMAEFYPRLAWGVRLTGKVRLACKQTAIGTLDHCSVLNERPAGLGFGTAAILLAGYFHTKPDPADDDVSFTILFTMPPDDSNQDNHLNYQPPPKPTLALALARQLVAAMQSTDQSTVTGNWCRDGLKGAVDQVVGEEAATPQSTAVLESFGQACSAQAPNFLEHIAAAYADTYSEAELTSILAFVKSPAGKAWTTRGKAVADDQRRSEAAIWEAVFADTRKRLCEKIEC